MRREICLNTLITGPRGESSLADSISWPPCEVAKCMTSFLKINIETSKTQVQNASSPILHTQRAQSKNTGVGSEGLGRRRGQRWDSSSLGLVLEQDWYRTRNRGGIIGNKSTSC